MFTPYPRSEDGYVVDQKDRAVGRAYGWSLLGGEVTSRTASIVDMSLTVAALERDDPRIREILALLRWTIPTLEQAMGGASRSGPDRDGRRPDVARRVVGSLVSQSSTARAVLLIVELDTAPSENRLKVPVPSMASSAWRPPRRLR